MKLTNLNFHLTFPPDGNMLSRLISSEIFGCEMTKEEISSQTGIPTGKSSGKVNPHIAYASYMGLVTDSGKEGKHLVQLTQLGRKILSEDPSLCEEVTVMTCFLRMVNQFTGAPLWWKMMCDILPQNPSGISMNAVNYELRKETTVNVDLGPFFSSMDSAFFAPLDLLSHDSESASIQKHTFNNDLVYAYAYGLFYEWSHLFPNQDEITANELGQLQVTKSLGWNSADLYAAMENMSEKGILRFNRQLAPFTVTKVMELEDIVDRLYSELF